MLLVDQKELMQSSVSKLLRLVSTYIFGNSSVDSLVEAATFQLCRKGNLLGQRSGMLPFINTLGSVVCVMLDSASEI